MRECLARRMREDGVGVGARVFRAIMDDVDSMCLVRECRELEKRLGVGFTDEILQGDGMVGMREVKEAVRKVDWERLVGRCKDKAYRIAIVREGEGWGKLWDHAMSLWLRHTRGLQNLLRLMSSHGKGERPYALRVAGQRVLEMR